MDSVAAAFDEGSPRVVFHLAALGVSPDRAHDPRVIDANVSMVANLIAAAQPETTVVLAGSMAEYGHGGVLKETDVCEPKTAYGIAKLAASHYATAYGPARSLRVRVGRLFGVYGPGESRERLFPTLVDALTRGRAVPLSDGMQKRDFIHVSDACEGLLRLSECTSKDVLVVNIGTGQAVQVRDVAVWTANCLGADTSLLRFGARPRSPGDADLLVADVSRMREALGWCPPMRLGPDMDIRELLGIAG
jgi:nucleoside-diphosphate-sugar epimerase